MALTRVANWGGPDTCFQLEGQLPIERRSADDRLWGCAAAHLGFYGYLRVANTHILRRAGVGLMDLSDHLWRDSYDSRLRPDKAADEAIADEAADMGYEL